MNEAANRHWWTLHQSAARGEDLTSDERAIYEAGLTRLHQEEVLDNDFADVQTRITALEQEQSELMARRDLLEAQISSLEAALAL